MMKFRKSIEKNELSSNEHNTNKMHGPRVLEKYKEI